MRAAAERLRQEAETFDLAKAHADLWFRLRVRASYAGLVLLLIVAILCIHVVLSPQRYPQAAIVWAAGVLGTDILGIVAIILKTVLSPASMTRLTPVTARAIAARGGRTERQ